MEIYISLHSERTLVWLALGKSHAPLFNTGGEGIAEKSENHSEQIIQLVCEYLTFLVIEIKEHIKKKQTNRKKKKNSPFYYIGIACALKPVPLKRKVDVKGMSYPVLWRWELGLFGVLQPTANEEPQTASWIMNYLSYMNMRCLVMFIVRRQLSYKIWKFTVKPVKMSDVCNSFSRGFPIVKKESSLMALDMVQA